MNNPENKLDSEYTLVALKILENQSSATQRELSRQMNLSVGKINFLIKSMIQRGLLTAQRFTNSKNKSAYFYVLTPQGMENKVRLTRNFLKRKMIEYDVLKEQIQNLQADLEIHAQNVNKTG